MLSAHLHAALNGKPLNVPNNDADSYENYRSFVLDCFDPTMFGKDSDFATFVDETTQTFPPERRSIARDFLSCRALDKLLFEEGKCADKVKQELKKEGLRIRNVTQDELGERVLCNLIPEAGGIPVKPC